MNMKTIIITIGVCGVISTLLALIGGWPLVCFFWLVAITGAATLYPVIELDAAAIDAAAPETDDIIGDGTLENPATSGSITRQGMGRVAGAGSVNAGSKEPASSPPVREAGDFCCNQPAATTTIAMPNDIEAYRLRSISMSTYDRNGRITGPSSMISVPIIGVVG